MSRMTTSYKGPGETLSLLAPYDVAAGDGAQVGSIFGVACEDYDYSDGDTGQFVTCGEFYLAKVTTETWTLGQKIYWDNSAYLCTSVATAGMLIGCATATTANPSTRGYVRLNGAAPGSLEGPQAAEADLVDSSGGAAADGTIGAVTAPSALTDNGAGTADGTVEAMAAVSTGGGNTYSDAAVNAVFAAIRNNFKEFTTTQAANRLAIIALTDAVKELSTKQNALLAKLRITGQIAP